MTLLLIPDIRTLPLNVVYYFFSSIMNFNVSPYPSNSKCDALLLLTWMWTLIATTEVMTSASMYRGGSGIPRTWSFCSSNHSWLVGQRRFLGRHRQFRLNQRKRRIAMPDFERF